MTENEISKAIVDAAIEVHREVGGLVCSKNYEWQENPIAVYLCVFAISASSR